MIQHARFKVTVNIPDGMTMKEMGDYIKQAIQCWAGGKDPDCPIFDLDKSKVKVERFFVKQKRPNPNSRTQLKKKLREQGT